MPHIVDPTLRKPAIDIYAAILESWRDHGESPTKAELRAATGYSLTTIQQMVDILRKKGHLNAPKFAVRSLTPTDWDVTLGNTEPDPWDALKTVKFWKEPDWTKK